MTVHSVAKTASAVVTIEFADHPPLAFDLAKRAFLWSELVEEFPRSVTVLRARIEDPLDALTMARLPWRDAEPLLWSIGLAAFPTGSAGWLHNGHRYRLTRWPNLAILPHTSNQMRMVALLANAAMTSEELARVAKVDEVEAKTLITALSLIGLLAEQPVEATSAPVVRERDESRGLFRRLRDRLGI
jgi:hypothetical protein